MKARHAEPFEGLLDFGSLKVPPGLFWSQKRSVRVWKNDRPSCYHLRLERIL